MEKEWYFVINPKSGKGTGILIWQNVFLPILKESSVQFSFGISDYHKHTIKLVKAQYQKGIRNFIGIGGDGTINEIVNAIFQSQEFKTNSLSTIGLIPVGTGNDWIRNHKLFTPSNIVNRLKAYQTLPHDVGVFNSSNLKHYFINVAGGGLDGAVASEIITLQKQNKKNKLSYLSSTLKTLINYKAKKTSIQVDHQLPITEQLLLATASIGKYFGNGMMISPKAHFKNGFLDFTIVRDDSNWTIFPQLPKLFTGKIETVSFVQKHNGKEMVIKSEKPIPVQADGENLGCHENFSLSVLKHAIQVLD